MIRTGSAVTSEFVGLANTAVPKSTARMIKVVFLTIMLLFEFWRKIIPIFFSLSQINHSKLFNEFVYQLDNLLFEASKTPRF